MYLEKTQEKPGLFRVSLKNKRVAGKLYGLAIDITVNPQWGIWSLSNEELLSDQAFHVKFNEVAGVIGISASITSAKELIQEAWKHKRLGKGGWITIVIWGGVIFNNNELSKVNTELSNRSNLKSSVLY